MDKIKKYGRLSVIVLSWIVLLCAIYGDEYDVNIGDGYKYSYDCGHILGPIDIPSKIVSFSYDDSYIVATQEYKGGSPVDMYDIGYYDGVPLNSYDSDGDGIIYWIVNKKTNRNILCGDSKEFMQICEAMGVSDMLVSDIVNKTE